MSLIQHAEKMVDIWMNGKIDRKEDGRLTTDDAMVKNQLEMDLIKRMPFNKHVHQSVYNINTKGEVELAMPLGTPSWVAGEEMNRAKNHERYSKVARRLQMKLIAKGKTREELNSLRSF